MCGCPFRLISLTWLIFAAYVVGDGDVWIAVSIVYPWDGVLLPRATLFNTVQTTTRDRLFGMSFFFILRTSQPTLFLIVFVYSSLHFLGSARHLIFESFLVGLGFVSHEHWQKPIVSSSAGVCTFDIDMNRFFSIASRITVPLLSWWEKSRLLLSLHFTSEIFIVAHACLCFLSAQSCIQPITVRLLLHLSHNQCFPQPSTHGVFFSYSVSSSFLFTHKKKTQQGRESSPASMFCLFVQFAIKIFYPPLFIVLPRGFREENTRSLSSVFMIFCHDV